MTDLEKIVSDASAAITATTTLADLAVFDKAAFGKIVEQAKASLGA